MIYVYTDGSAHPTNPGPGGFGCIVVTDRDKIIQMYSKQIQEQTTNNREEMKAILWATIHYGKCGEPVIIYSDSAYAINSFSSWRQGWKDRGWLKSDKTPPENLDLIQAFDSLVEMGYKVEFQKIKGHSGHYFNELVDKLAKGEINPN